MADQTLRLVIGAALLLHGLGHGGAIGALAWVERFGSGNSGAWTAARSWLLPSMTRSNATVVACALWALAFVGFVAAALSFWAILPPSAWRGLAIASSIVSFSGILLFFGTWPMFNTLAAQAMNIAVLVALLVLSWPSESVVRG